MGSKKVTCPIFRSNDIRCIKYVLKKRVNNSTKFLSGKAGLTPRSSCLENVYSFHFSLEIQNKIVDLWPKLTAREAEKYNVLLGLRK